MNRDLIVFVILLLLLGVDGLGAWEIVGAFSKYGPGLAGTEPLMILSAFSVTGAVLTGFSVLLVRRIFSRLS